MPLSSLEPEDVSLVISLPYRVGVWMSHADDEGGEGDDASEGDALDRIIRKVGKRHESSPFVKETVGETLRRRKEWPSWGENILGVAQECEKALKLLKPVLDKPDFDAFRKVLYQIAATVAEAYGEFGEDEDSGGGGLVARLVGSAKNAVSGEKGGEFINISAAEREALETLEGILRNKKTA